MNIQSVTSGASRAYANQAAQASKSQQTQQPQLTQQLAAPPEKKDEAPKPIVNTSGQKTGTTINVTA